MTLVSSQKVPQAWEQRCHATQDEPQCFATPKIEPLYSIDRYSNLDIVTAAAEMGKWGLKYQVRLYLQWASFLSIKGLHLLIFSSEPLKC